MPRKKEKTGYNYYKILTRATVFLLVIGVLFSGFKLYNIQAELEQTQETLDELKADTIDKDTLNNRHNSLKQNITNIYDEIEYIKDNAVSQEGMNDYAAMVENNMTQIIDRLDKLNSTYRSSNQPDNSIRDNSSNNLIVKNTTVKETYLGEHVQGIVTNNGSSQGVHIEVTAVNSEGVVLQRNSDYVSNLKTGRSYSFQVLFLEDIANNTSKYKVKANYYGFK